MIETTITCDNCKREKNGANRWWVINAAPDRRETKHLYVIPYSNAPDAEINSGAHACSRECAHKIIEQWMAKTEGQ